MTVPCDSFQCVVSSCERTINQNLYGAKYHIKYGWAPTDSQAKYVLGRKRIVQLCLADRFDRVIRCGVPDLCKVCAERNEPAGFSDRNLHCGGSVLSTYVLSVESERESYLGIQQTQLGSLCVRNCSCRVGSRLCICL